jgi:hypothetical protein
MSTGKYMLIEEEKCLIKEAESEVHLTIHEHTAKQELFFLQKARHSQR